MNIQQSVIYTNKIDFAYTLSSSNSIYTVFYTIHCIVKSKAPANKSSPGFLGVHWGHGPSCLLDNRPDELSSITSQAPV